MCITNSGTPKKRLGGNIQIRKSSDCRKGKSLCATEDYFKFKFNYKLIKTNELY